ncbi:hypothetical protein Fmac_009977 [Flemingia macrophylla]|uniref:Cinnamyl alcohol dehydrogenase n=1 Tax=Flemingia macrophylla TaxID=520843 RepID=A0ABD1N1T0_9FABA
MVRYKMNQPGKSLGVIGLGGVGHMAVKFGKAFGLNVTVFSTSISKKEETLSLLGADKFVVSSNQEEMTPRRLFREALQVAQKKQEMIDVCAANGIYPNIEVVPIEYANEAFERLIKRDVKYRFVIDIENSLK